MRSHKSIILIALVALLLTALVAVTAQQKPAQDTAKTADMKPKAESCCSDGSCPMMKKEGETASADVTTAGADAKHDCCGDSCNMKEGAANADSAAAGADAKHDCCGDSCDMANHAKNVKHDMKHSADMKHAADGSCCKAKQKDAKQKDAKEKP
jgi:hypothetical protein